MKRSSGKFALCVDNDGYAASLIAGKIYRMIPDPRATADGLVRIVDEDAEDYLYPANRFMAVEIPPAAARRLRALEKAT